MVELIPPVDPRLIAAEFTELPLLREFRGLELYRFSAHECPQAMREIGRLRETAYREAGAGRAVACDIDELDTAWYGYRQIAAWDPRHREIVAMYRYQLGSAVTQAGDSALRTSRLFDYSPHFRREILPDAIELGRSVVQQSAARRVLGLFAVWCGLGAVLQQHPGAAWFFGNVSLYQGMHPAALEYLIHFLETHYAPPQPMLQAHPHLRPHYPASRHGQAHPPRPLSTHPDDTPAARIARLKQELAAWNESIPPILQSYLRLGCHIWFGETARDADFGNALEIGIIVPVPGIEPDLKAKFIDPP